MTLYCGDELGLPDNPRRPDGPRDGFGRRNPTLSRDPARAPMPWDGSPHRGFSRSEPWLPTYAGTDAIDAAAQRQIPTSPLTLYRRLLELRRTLGWSRGSVSLSGPDAVVVLLAAD